MASAGRIAPERWSTIVVGAGPAGAVASLELARRGQGPVLLLDAAPWPRVKPCGSGLSLAALGELDRLGLRSRVERQAYPIGGAIIGSPSGRELLLEGEANTFVAAREQLDGLLVQVAQEAGVIFRPETGVSALRPATSGGFRVQTAAGQSLWAKWVVVATGALGALTGRRLPPSWLTSIVGWYRGLEFRPGTLELYFDRELAPHYGWVFPEGPDRVNVGLCLDARRRGDRPLRGLMQGFIDRHLAHRMTGAEPWRPWRGAPIAAGPRPSFPRLPAGILTVGEAAHLANRATGEGISLALGSGRVAADILARGARQGWSPERVTQTYADRLILGFTPRLWVAHRFAAAAPAFLDLAARLGRRPAVRRALSRVLAAL